MMKLGTGTDGELTLIDIMAVISFFISLANLDENLSQSDKADLQNSLQEEMHKALEEIHTHLTKQDQKIETLLQILEEEQK